MTWGNWFLDIETSEDVVFLVHKKTGYWIPDERWHEPYWTKQLKSKTWADDQDVHDLETAFRYLRRIA
jgi:hypothetical protein